MTAIKKGCVEWRNDDGRNKIFEIESKKKKIHLVEDS